MNKQEGSFLQMIRQAFGAFSCEHYGEMLSVKEKNRVLSGASIDSSVVESGRLSADLQIPTTKPVFADN